MQSDTLVFDIETKNFFSDPEVGEGNFGAIEISVVGVYSYEKDKYRCFGEEEMKEAAELFGGAARLVGFASNRFDVPVLNLAFQRINGANPNLWAKERVDLLEIIRVATGNRVSLNRLAEANLGEGKSGRGVEAVNLYALGRIDELKEYCLRDVELTKRLYDMALKVGHLLVPRRKEGTVEKVPIAISPSKSATLL